jgi:hypothetical protein
MARDQSTLRPKVASVFKLKIQAASRFNNTFEVTPSPREGDIFDANIT